MAKKRKKASRPAGKAKSSRKTGKRKTTKKGRSLGRLTTRDQGGQTGPPH